MKNQRNHTRQLCGLALALVSLVIGIAVPLASTTVVGSVKQSDSGSISSVHGQENPLSLNRWSSNGPEGATVLCLAIDPSRPAAIYAGTAGYGGDYLTNGGLFKSTDGGEGWSHRWVTSAV